ncbi:MAG TPA: uroporphyrinogen-III C-methyltransferase, partial [Acetobacteraceae bacterium]|nr:uroporphyrinogen-III C-methyltransferase [Acetobacteraceae bacterium]
AGAALPPCGEVYLVGAGPGEADLLTFRALRLMQKADVVLYDRLVSPGIVDLVRREAERIYVGKRRDDHALPQEEIGALLVRLAREGKRVLRLKGGDPYVFGRGGEEALVLAAHGIPFRVIPGITAGIGGLAAALIPVTMRGINQAVILATGHAAEEHEALDWAAVARLGQPIVLYMALARLAGITGALIAGGRAPETPAAAITAATTERQRIVVSTLGALTEAVETAGLHAPVLVVVGEIVTVREQLLALLPEAAEALHWPDPA